MTSQDRMAVVGAVFVVLIYGLLLLWMLGAL